MPESLTLTAQRTLAYEARTLSSGTMAHLTGYATYDAIDTVQAAFAAWCERHPHYTTWQAAWTVFQASREPQAPAPRRPVQQQFEFGLFTA